MVSLYFRDPPFNYNIKHKNHCSASILDLYSGANGDIVQLDNSSIVYVVMSIGIVLKLVLWVYCVRANESTDGIGRPKSDQLTALAEDHANDVVSNIGAIITLAIAVYTPAVSINVQLCDVLWCVELFLVRLCFFSGFMSSMPLP